MDCGEVKLTEVKNVVLGRSQETGKRSGKEARGVEMGKGTEKREEGCQWGRRVNTDKKNKNRREERRGKG